MIYVIVVVCYAILLMLTNPSGWVQNKIFDRRLSNIKYCCRLADSESMSIAINHNNKSHDFDISIRDDKHDSISILTAYSSSSVYINGEKVCTMHRLHKAFHIDRVVEYSDNHKIDEIDRIIKHANEYAKKKIDEYTKSRIGRDRNKSLFD